MSYRGRGGQKRGDAGPSNRGRGGGGRSGTYSGNGDGEGGSGAGQGPLDQMMPWLAKSKASHNPNHLQNEREHEFLAPNSALLQPDLGDDIVAALGRANRRMEWAEGVEGPHIKYKLPIPHKPARDLAQDEPAPQLALVRRGSESSDTEEALNDDIVAALGRADRMMEWSEGGEGPQIKYKLPIPRKPAPQLALARRGTEAAPEQQQDHRHNRHHDQQQQRQEPIPGYNNVDHARPQQQWEPNQVQQQPAANAGAPAGITWGQLRQHQQQPRFPGRSGRGVLGTAGHLYGRGRGGTYYGQARGRGYRGQARGGKVGVGPRQRPRQEDARSLMQRSSFGHGDGAWSQAGRGGKTQAQADFDPAVGSECKICRLLSHMEQDCAKGSRTGGDSTYCFVHRGRLYEVGEACSGSVDHCWAALMKNPRMDRGRITEMVFRWVVTHRCSRPEPRCANFEWHWAICVADYMEANPEVSVDAGMLPVRRDEFRSREKHRKGDPARSWKNFDFADEVKSRLEFKDIYWDTDGDRAELIKRLKKYGKSGPGLYRSDASEEDKAEKDEDHWSETMNRRLDAFSFRITDDTASNNNDDGTADIKMEF